MPTPKPAYSYNMPEWAGPRTETGTRPTAFQARGSTWLHRYLLFWAVWLVAFLVLLASFLVTGMCLHLW